MHGARATLGVSVAANMNGEAQLEAEVLPERGSVRDHRPSGNSIGGGFGSGQRARRRQEVAKSNRNHCRFEVILFLLHCRPIAHRSGSRLGY